MESQKEGLNLGRKHNFLFYYIFGFLVFFLIVGIFSGCGGGGSKKDEIYHYAGGGAPGDFYQLTANMTKNTISFKNMVTGESGTLTFQKVSPGVYQDSDGDLFVMIPNQMVVTAVEGQLIVALKEPDEPYGAEIGGDYYYADLWGEVGTANVDTAEKIITSSYGDDLTYQYNPEYKAIEFTDELNLDKGYGIYLNNEVSVWDLYWREFADDDFEPGGIVVLVRQGSNYDPANYAGTYYFLDREGDYGKFKIEATTAGIDRIVLYEEEEDIIVPGSQINDSGDGHISFEADLVGADEPQEWNLLILPGKVLIIACEAEEAYGEEGEEDGGILAVAVCP